MIAVRLAAVAVAVWVVVQMQIAPAYVGWVIVVFGAYFSILFWLLLFIAVAEWRKPSAERVSEIATWLGLGFAGSGIGWGAINGNSVMQLVSAVIVVGLCVVVVVPWARIEAALVHARARFRYRRCGGDPVVFGGLRRLGDAARGVQPRRPRWGELRRLRLAYEDVSSAVVPDFPSERDVQDIVDELNALDVGARWDAVVAVLDRELVNRVATLNWDLVEEPCQIDDDTLFWGEVIQLPHEHRVHIEGPWYSRNAPRYAIVYSERRARWELPYEWNSGLDSDEMLPSDSRKPLGEGWQMSVDSRGEEVWTLTIGSDRTS